MEDSKHPVQCGDPLLSSNINHFFSAAHSPTAAHLQCCNSFDGNDCIGDNAHDCHNPNCQNNANSLDDLYQNTVSSSPSTVTHINSNCCSSKRKNMGNSVCCLTTSCHQPNHHHHHQQHHQQQHSQQEMKHCCDNNHYLNHSQHQITSMVNKNDINSLSASPSTLQHGRDPLLSSSHHQHVDQNLPLNGLESSSLQHHNDHLHDDEHVGASRASDDLSSAMMSDSLSLVSSATNDPMLLSPDSLDIDLA